MGAAEEAVGGTELRVDGIALEARDGVSTSGEAEVRFFFASRGAADGSSLRLDPEETVDEGVPSRPTTFSLPSEEP